MGKTMKKHKDRDLMTKARDALRILAPLVNQDMLENLIYDLDDRIAEMIEEEAYYIKKKETRDKLSLSAQGNRNKWKPEIDAQCKQVQKHREEGLTIKKACELVGITEDTWYRRQRIEAKGRDRG